ncbi:MAG TPA: hypothetical protein VFD15_06410 [Clostridia bacterium]|nr:hypothetical protein [Clostridia bacterium]
MNEELKSKQINFRMMPKLYDRFTRARKAMGHTQTDALIMLVTEYCQRVEKEKRE